MAEKCYCCGAVSEVPGTYAKVYRTFRLGAYPCCPTCFGGEVPPEQLERPVKDWNVPFLLMLFGPMLLLMYASESAGGLWILLNVFLLQTFALAALWLHELGHALASRALGMRVFKICLGVGPAFWTGTVFGFVTEFRPLQLGGWALVAHRETTGIRRRELGSVLAGPAVNLLLGAAVLLFMPWEQLWRFDALEKGPAWGQVFFYANLVMLALSLWPLTARTPFGLALSDGRALWRALSGKLDPEGIHAQWFLGESLMLWESGKPAEAMEWIDRGLGRYPQNLQLLWQRASYLHELRRWEEVRELQLALLARAALPEPLRGSLFNGLAYTDALLGRPELLPEADRCSQEAMARRGWDSVVKGTRGTVLMLTGRMTEGIPLLRESLEDTDHVQGQAENHCWLAMGHARLEEWDEAREHLAEAERLQPDCFLLERARREVGDGKMQ